MWRDELSAALARIFALEREIKEKDAEIARLNKVLNKDGARQFRFIRRPASGPSIKTLEAVTKRMRELGLKKEYIAPLEDALAEMRKKEQ